MAGLLLARGVPAGSIAPACPRARPGRLSGPAGERRQEQVYVKLISPLRPGLVTGEADRTAPPSRDRPPMTIVDVAPRVHQGGVRRRVGRSLDGRAADV